MTAIAWLLALPLTSGWQEGGGWGGGGGGGGKGSTEGGEGGTFEFVNIAWLLWGPRILEGIGVFFFVQSYTFFFVLHAVP